MLEMPASSPQGMHRQSPSGYSQNEFTPGQGEPFASAVNELGQLAVLVPHAAVGVVRNHLKLTLSELAHSAVVVQTWCESVPYSHSRIGLHGPPAVGTVAGHWGLRSVTVEASTPELALVPFSRPPQPSDTTRATVEMMRAARCIGVTRRRQRKG
jgi:hypothetical protein